MDSRIKDRLFTIMIIFPLLTILGFALFSHAVFAEMKIGYINSQRIIEESKAGEITNRKREQFIQESTAKLEQKNKEIEDLQQELRKKEFAITPEKKQELEEKIRDKNMELKFFKESKEKELKESIRKAFKQLVRDMQNEPSLIIETRDTSDTPDVTLEDIREWLFRRR